jgi:hypothetical protein
MSAAKTTRLKVRNSNPAVFHDVTPETWEKMQKTEANRAFYEEVTAPAIPKEVAEKSATHKKLAPDKTGASDKHESTTNSARLPDENAGKVE